MTRWTTAEKFDFALLRQKLAIVHWLLALHHFLEQEVAIVGEDCAIGVVLLEGLGCRLAHLDGPMRVCYSGLKLKKN